VIEIRSEVGKIVGAKQPGSPTGQRSNGHKPDNVALVSTPADALLNTMQRNHAGPSLPPGPLRAPSRSLDGGAGLGGSGSVATAPSSSNLTSAALPPAPAPEITTLQVRQAGTSLPYFAPELKT
jgi:hypothetical protein